MIETERWCDKYVVDIPAVQHYTIKVRNNIYEIFRLLNGH